MNARTYYSHDAEVHAQQSRIILSVITILLGIGLGSALALLFAPQSGRKTREQLGSQAEQVSKEVLENASQLRSDLTEKIGAARK